MIRLRRATPRDEALLLRLRNERSARAQFFDSKPVTKAQHQAWFSKKLQDKKCALFVIESARRPVGQVRLDLNGSTATVSVTVDPKARGRGVGAQALRLAAKGRRKLVAFIKEDNAASAIAFLKAGFRFVKCERKVYRMERS